ncbi:hypothetical protein J6590_058397 [Homalodisca vitripennis]|nr:hypothetical protein J6590_058397 [Homalodisca vitripennis]
MPYRPVDRRTTRWVLAYFKRLRSHGYTHMHSCMRPEKTACVRLMGSARSVVYFQLRHPTSPSPCGISADYISMRRRDHFVSVIYIRFVLRCYAVEWGVCSCSSWAVSVVAEMWNLEHLTQSQRDFRAHFNVARHGAIPDRNTILRWIHNVNTTGSLLKKKPPGPVTTVTTPETVERVRLATAQSPSRSIRKRASALGLRPSTVRKILVTHLKGTL